MDPPDRTADCPLLQTSCTQARPGNGTQRSPMTIPVTELSPHFSNSRVSCHISSPKKLVRLPLSQGKLKPSVSCTASDFFHLGRAVPTAGEMSNVVLAFLLGFLLRPFASCLELGSVASLPSIRLK